MGKTGFVIWDSLKVVYPNIIHVTYVTYMLNRVAEKVRKLFPDVNKFFNNVKKSFWKSPAHIQLYKKILPGLLLQSVPVIYKVGLMDRISYI